MKKKDLKKISNHLFNNLEKARQGKIAARKMYETEPAVEENAIGYEWCEYDEDVTNRFKKLLSNILTYTDNLRIECTNSYISITTDSVKDIKKSGGKSSYNSSGMGSVNTKKSSEDDYLRIEVIKDKGFAITYGYNKMSRYVNPNIYTEVFDEVKNRLKEMNAENFTEIWEKINKESGLMRDSNLSDIFNDQTV